MATNKETKERVTFRLPDYLIQFYRGERHGDFSKNVREALEFYMRYIEVPEGYTRITIDISNEAMKGIEELAERNDEKPNDILSTAIQEYISQNERYKQKKIDDYL